MRNAVTVIASISAQSVRRAPRTPGSASGEERVEHSFERPLQGQIRTFPPTIVMTGSIARISSSGQVR